jgi:predicted RNase H-like HicB family nuclease
LEYYPFLLYKIETRYVNERWKMQTKLKMLYWKGEKFWVGKLIEHPEIMTQGETLEELEENMKDAYILMTMEDVPKNHKVKELTLNVWKGKTWSRKSLLLDARSWDMAAAMIYTWIPRPVRSSQFPDTMK